MVNADVSIYVNGIKQSNSSVSWPSIVNNVFNAAGYGMYIGSTYGQNNQMYNGEMFDIFWVDGQASHQMCLVSIKKATLDVTAGNVY